MLKVVVAPNAFKGTLTASQAAAAIARGVREVFPDAEVVEVPVADGGDGTVEALVSANHGQYRTAEVEGPLGDPVKATYGLIGKGGTVLELAAASGLALVPHSRRDPRKTSTYGFGQLLQAARAPGTMEFIVGIGARPPTMAGPGWRRLWATACWMLMTGICPEVARRWPGSNASTPLVLSRGPQR